MIIDPGSSSLLIAVIYLVKLAHNIMLNFLAALIAKVPIRMMASNGLLSALL